MSPVTPTSLRRRHVLLRVLAAGAAVAMICAVLPRAVDYQRSRLAAQLAAAARTADGATALAIVRQLDGLGDCALGPLVALAGDSSSVAGAAAREAILDRFVAITATEYLHAESAGGVAPHVDAPPLIGLADALAAHAESFDARTQPWATRLALRIVRRCDSLPAEQALLLAGHCDRVVSVCQSAGQLAAAGERRDAAAGKSSQARAPRTYPLGDAHTAPIDLSPRFADAAPPADASLSVVAPGRDDQADQRRNEEAQPPVAVQQPDAVADSKKPPLAAPSTAEARPIPKPLDPNAVVVASSPRSTQRRLLQLQKLSNPELESLRDAATGFDATAIAEILQQRAAAIARLKPGAQDAPASLAGRAGLEQLSTLGADQARELLRKLVQDEDPAVRLEAIAILATSADPQAAKILEERALRDADPRVADLATQILHGERK